MSSHGKLSVLAWALAFASTALATPFAAGHKHAHAHAHEHLHNRAPLAPYPYPGKNTTALAGITGVPTYSTPPAPYYSQAAPADSQAAPAYSQAAPAATPDETVTTYSTQYVTVFRTVLAVSPSSGSAGAAQASAPGRASGDQCHQDVTVTTTEKVYVTVTAGQVPSRSAPSPVASAAAVQPADVPSSASPSSVPSHAPNSAPSAPLFSPNSAPSSSSEPSPISSARASIALSYPAASTPTGSATNSSSTSSSLGSGKRGLAYNTADLLTCFEDSKEITWAYNWVSASAGLMGNLHFIPTLHDGTPTFVDVWQSEASASIATGSKTLFSFNEPDESSQANMTPEAAAQAYITHMNPFAGKAQLCAPSVTNGGGEMGLTWLQNFITACAGNCHIDCYNIHWYSPVDSAGFKAHVNQAIQIAGDKPVWVSEFGCTGASDGQVSSFLEDVMPWMDTNDSIAGYAYYMASDGNLLSGTEPSTYGQTYATYTS